MLQTEKNGARTTVLAPLCLQSEEVEKSTSSFSENTNLSAEKSYTKTEINRMSTADLQKLANEQGFDKAEEISGADLKKMLIEKFGL